MGSTLSDIESLGGSPKIWITDVSNKLYIDRHWVYELSNNATLSERQNYATNTAKKGEGSD